MLEQERLAGQLVVIEAARANALAEKESERQLIEVQKENELLSAELDIEINARAAEAAEELAKANTAQAVVLAQLYGRNPEYVSLLIAEANASALTETDKIIFTTEGTTPSIVIPGPGIVPTVDTASGQ